MADYTQQGLYQEGNSLFDDIFAFGNLEVQNINVVGIITAKTFSGIDATSLKDNNGAIRIQATTTGATHSGRAVFNEVELQGKVYDSDGDFGTSGQVLSSDGTDIEWVNAGSLSAGSAAQVTVVNEASDTTCFPLFSTAATGNLQTKSNSNLTFNSSTGELNSTKFVGDGSALTGFTAAQIPTINQDTTGTATNATNFNVTANNSTNETVFPVFVDGATGNQGGETDTGFTYNPSTGNLTSSTFTGNLTGNVTGNISGQLTGAIQTAAQTNITSVGTLTGLTVDGNVTLDNTSNYLHIKGALYDKDGQSGSADQVLVSTGTQVDWKDTTSLTASNSQKITIAESDTNSDFPITFSAAPGQSGGNTLLSDNQFTYNASTNTVTAGTFSGSGASLTSLPSQEGIDTSGSVTDYSSLTTSSLIMMGNTFGSVFRINYDNFNQSMTMQTGDSSTRNYGTIKIRTGRGGLSNSSDNPYYVSGGNTGSAGSGSSILISHNSGEIILGNATGNINLTQSSGNHRGFKVYLDGRIDHVSKGSYGMKMVNRGFSSSFKQVVFEETGGNEIGSITINNSANTTSFNETSDYRVKENVVGITSALDKINQLRPVNFNFIGKSVKLDGFLAHEVQAVVPYAVTGDKDAVKTVKDGDTSDEGTKEDAERIAALPTKEVAALQQLDKGKLIALLTASVQELSAKNDALEARIKALE